MKNRDAILQHIETALNSLEWADQLTHYEGIAEPRWWLSMNAAKRKLEEAKRALTETEAS